MNFKDAYKSYNDEIKGDPKVLDAILNGKKEIRKDTKKVFVMRPSLVGAMAAMVILAVSVFGFNNLANKNSTPEKTYIAARKTDTPKDIPNAEFKATNNETENTDSALQRANLQNTEKQNTYVETENILQQETPSQDTVPFMASAQDEATISDMPMTAGIVSSDGDMPAYDTENVTTDDCYAYFGFSVTDTAKLPEDMTFGGNVIINTQSSPQTGEMEYCSFCIDAYSQTDPKRILEVCVTKQVAPMEDAGTAEYYTHEETGEPCGGKCVTENMSFRVNSQNVTHAEVAELLNSLKDN